MFQDINKINTGACVRQQRSKGLVPERFLVTFINRMMMNGETNIRIFEHSFGWSHLNTL